MGQETPAKRFYVRWLQRAWAGKFGWANTAAGLLALIALPVGLWLWPTAEGTMNWVPLILFGSLFVISLAYGLVYAPYAMYRELEQTNLKLRDRLFNRERREAAIAKQWALRTEGVDIRNETVDLAALRAWLKRLEEWREKVLTEAGAVSKNLQAWLETLDRVRPPPNLSPAANGEHQTQRANMSEILARLQEFLQAEMLNKDIDRGQW